jgi:hypothetical protein
MKTAGESLQGAASSGNVAEFPGYTEDQLHDQESCSRMDSEGCPNGGTEEDGFRAAELATVKLRDRTSNLNSRLEVIAEKQPEEI